MSFLDLLFPRRCVGCGRWRKYFCQKCTSSIEFVSRPICPICEKPAIDGATHPRCQTRYTLDGLTSFFRYNGVIRQAIKLLKYRFVSDLVSEFISLIPNDKLTLFSKPYTLIPKPFILLPIPLHPSRLRFRGFNQAEVLGKLLANHLNIPIKTNILKRIRRTTPQVEVKDRNKRLKNMEGVFAVNQSTLKNSYLVVRSTSLAPRSESSGQAISNQQLSILLFDDVFTTGATLRSAANVLKRAGVKKVWGIVMAHG